jgi:antitoxin component YwqK of YwqJK toxin-antitoxin module
MKTIKSILLGALAISFIKIQAQQPFKSFYDYKKTKVKEEYFINSAGQKNGLYKQYLESGLVEVQGAYKNDKKVGIWYYILDAQGSKNINTYDNEGNANGLFLEHCFSSPKSRLSEGYYKTDKKDGIWKEYFCPSDSLKVSDKLQKLTTYSLGVLNGTYTEYYSNGKVKVNGEYKSNMQNGEWKEFDKNGNLIISTMYGKKLGNFYLVEETKYFESGYNRKLKHTLLCGFQGRISKIGEELYYDSTGVLFAKNIWNKDSITDTRNNLIYQGIHEEYFPNGKLSDQCQARYDNYSDQTFYIGHEIRYYLNGNKKYECDIDNNGNLINGTLRNFKENGEPK